MSRRGRPQPEPPVRRPVPVTDLLVFAAAALLPLAGNGILLDELPTPGTYLGRLVLFGLLLVALLGTRGPRRRDPALPVVAAVLGFGLIASLVPHSGARLPGGFIVAYPADRAAAVQELLRLLLLAVAVAAAARASRTAVLGGLSAGGLLLGLRAMREYLPELRAGDATWRVFAGFGSPNQTATFCVVALPLLVALVFVIDEKTAAVRWLTGQGIDRAGLKLRVGVALAALLLLLTLGLTQSRGGLLALGVGLLAVLAGMVRLGRRREALLLLGVGLVIAVAMAVGPLRPRLLAAAAQAHSRGFRLLTWAGTLDLIRAQLWLGVGLGGWPLASPLYAQAAYTQHAHNGYLQHFAESGLGGFLAYLALFGTWLRSGWRALGRGDRPARLLGLATLAAVTGFAVHNAFDYGWYVTAVPLFAGMLAATLAPPDERPARLTPRVRTALLLLGGVAVLLVLGLTWRSEQLRAAGRQAVNAGYRATALDRYRAAARLAAWRPEVWEDLAGLLAGMGRGEEALAAYQQALARRPASARLHYRVAALDADWGRLEEAVGSAELAVALSPMHLQGYLLEGRLREQAGQPAAARRVYQRLDELARLPALAEQDPLKEYTFEPTHAYGLMRLAALAAEAGDEAMACDAWRRAIPQFDAYLKTYRDALEQVTGLPTEAQRELLALRGLQAEERAEVEALRAEAAARLAACSR